MVKPKSSSKAGRYTSRFETDENERTSRFHHSAGKPTLSSNPGGGTSGNTGTESDDVSSRLGSTAERDFDLNPSQILGSFAPDFILSKLQMKPPIMKTSKTVCLMMDMSGFTALTEAYSLQGKGGTDKLSTTLSKVLVPLAERILTSRGDIVQFAGDAFIAYWIVESAARLPEIIQVVIDCALVCQNKHGKYETDVQIVVKIKIGISSGNSNILALGNEETSQFCIFGPSAFTSADAEGMASSGDVVIHPDAWQFCTPSHYKYQSLPKGYVKVTEVVKYLDRPPGNLQSIKVANKTRVTEVRPILDHLTTGKIDEDQLRRFMIPAVLRKLDDQLPLDYVNETRIVTIVFVKLEVVPSLKDDEYIFDVLQASFLKIIELAHRRNGCLTKVILFDKGWTFLLAFGLPGQVQENQGRSALKFSHRLKQALLQDGNIPEVSIGCTTGSVYCGIVGHPLRREYTMLGRAVNKAARIMCAYPGIVSCDSDTLYKSKLPQFLFQQLERKPIKGFKNPGTMFEFLGQDAVETSSIQTYKYPIVGRTEEMDVIRYGMSCCGHDLRQAVITAPAVNMGASESARTKRKVRFGGSGDEGDRKPGHSPVRIQMIVIEGAKGIGKTRLLSAAVTSAQTLKRWNVAAHVAEEQNSGNWILPLRQLMTKALNMQTIRTVKDKEQYLTRIAKVNNDTELLSSICVLNELFQISLPLTAKVISVNTDNSNMHKYTHFVLGQLLRYTNKDQCVLLAIQDGHFLHENTWQYLLSLSSLPFVFVLQTLLRNPDGLPKISDTAMRICYHVVGVTTLKLEGLEEECVLPLACQFLEVKAIPNGVEKLLKERSEGNPELLETLLQELQRTEKIEIIEADAPAVRLLRATLRYCDPKYLQLISETDWFEEASQQSGGDVRDASEIRALMGTSSTALSTINDPLDRVCVLKVKTVKDVTIGSLHKEQLLHELDGLNSNEQMMLKCASILGRGFSREMLDYVLPSYRGSTFKYLQSFVSLMEKGILVCNFLLKDPTINDADVTDKKKRQNFKCACSRNIGVRMNVPHEDDMDDEIDDEDGGSDLPSYAHCSYPAFANHHMVDVAFELLTTGQLAELSARAIEYLDHCVSLCKLCGGDDTRSKFGFDTDNITFTYKETESSVFAEQKSLLKGLHGIDSLAFKDELSMRQKFLLTFATDLQDLDSYGEIFEGSRRVKDALEDKILAISNGNYIDMDKDQALLVLDIYRTLKSMLEKYNQPPLPKCKLCRGKVKLRPSEMIRGARRSIYEDDEDDSIGSTGALNKDEEIPEEDEVKNYGNGSVELKPQRRTATTSDEAITMITRSRRMTADTTNFKQNSRTIGDSSDEKLRRRTTVGASTLTPQRRGTGDTSRLRRRTGDENLEFASARARGTIEGSVGNVKRSSKRRTATNEQHLSSILTTRADEVEAGFSSRRGAAKRSAVVLDLDETVVEFDNHDSSGNRPSTHIKRSALSTIESVSDISLTRGSVAAGSDARRRSSRRSSRRQSSQNSKSVTESGRKSTIAPAGVEALARLSTISKPRRSLQGHPPGCRCDIISAKIEFELSKHYKNAGYLEQSLGCLLCAIEFIINSGDTDDAFFLLIDLPDHCNDFKESVVEAIEEMRKVTNPFFLTKATFLKAVANFQTSDFEQAKKYFMAILRVMSVSIDEERPPTWWEIMRGKTKLWLRNRRSVLKLFKKVATQAFQRRQALSKMELSWSDMKVLSTAMIIISLAYLQEINKIAGNSDVCSVLCAKQTIHAESCGGNVNILIPTYCNAMDGLAGVGRYSQVEEFEEKALRIYERFFAFNEMLSEEEAVLTTNLFLSVATARLHRGETRTAAESSYAALRVASFIHNPHIMCHIFPVLVHALMFLLKINETVEALQQLWYYAEEEEDDIAMAIYFCTNLDLILDCACTVEPFYYCERFVSGKKWRKRLGTYRDLELQYNLETSVALWFARYSKWGTARTWMDSAWRRIPKTKSFHSVSGDLKLFQCYLLLRYYRLSQKNLDNFQVDWQKALELRSSLKKSTVAVPILQSRFHHLESYYHKLLKHERKSRQELKKARDIAQRHDNQLEINFIEHTRLVWEDRCLPSVEFYWLDHSDDDRVDWHAVERMPMANIMYTLPIREDEENVGEEVDV